MLCSVPLSDVKAKSPRWRFNISLLSNQTFITSLKEYIKEFIEINMPSDVDPQILWETTKCAIRGFCISFSSTLAKAKTHQFTQLENKIQSLQNLQKQHFTEQQAEHGVFHRDQKTSLISLLLKKGKDPLDCSSYRPISLIPCDLKIYAKVFASRMEKVIHSLIKEDQTGFIKRRNASDNMRRLLHILDFADSHPTPCAVFSLDAEKAFDRQEWNYMLAVLQCFGFGEHLVSMIKTLYHSPAASVITGNIISPSFPLQRGTRQGCPLSPLLFCLSLEPLAQAIRKSEVSIKIHDHNHSISLYADDMILYLDHFDVSVSSIIKEFDNFSSLSGYKINWSKSALMPINNVKVNFSIPSFIPIMESFIYLGITIYKNINKIARDNFNNILVKVKNDIQRWKNLKVSLQGRISTVKMNLLPRFNFFSLCYHFLPLQVTLRRSTP